MNDDETAFYYRRDLMPADVHTELTLIGGIVIQFERMDVETRQRILGYLNSRYGEARP